MKVDLIQKIRERLDYDLNNNLTLTPYSAFRRCENILMPVIQMLIEQRNSNIQYSDDGEWDWNWTRFLDDQDKEIFKLLEETGNDVLRPE